MKSFISAKEYKKVKEKPNIEKMDLFIEMMSQEIERGKSLSLNTALDNIPQLNDVEFDLVSKQAYKDGWKLEKIEDNYNTLTYNLERIVLNKWVFCLFKHINSFFYFFALI